MNQLNHQCDSSGDQADPDRLSDQAWLTEVFRENELPMMGYATQLLGDRDRASDVVQDTFVRLCRQPRQQVQDRVRQWLFRVCRNRALDILKKESRMKTLDDASAARQVSRDAGPQSVVEMAERHENAQSLLATLPAKQQEVIRLKIHGDLSYREISELTGLSVGNVGYLLSTGLKLIRNRLAAAE
ncbi:ECF RNA polymerase sigma factor SigE [Stieleria maiorica]|uniref:ECF RNA polymerase sigma factor SigE n=1 Tax=Stieleria maiorica TaxID=2795974 RepID=A0A5B9MBG3_9BACT|nr:ECF RNA polymerase sigma factor SigE [Stieleria maiorica]